MYKGMSTFVIVAISFCILISVVFAAQDKYTVKIPDGLAFSEFKGYEDWQTVAVSVTETSVKSILANPTMIKAYKEGSPGNGKPFPQGSKIVKIEWIKEKNPVSPYFVEMIQSDLRIRTDGRMPNLPMTQLLTLSNLLLPFP
jgi:hypothetical protein